MATTGIAPRHRSLGLLQREHRRLHRSERWAAGLEVLMSIGGLGGGAYMVTHPLTMMPLDLLSRTPFSDWTWPGVFLLAFVGVGPLLAAAAQLLRMGVAPWAHVITGAGMIAWIVVEVAWVVWAPMFDFPYIALGAAILACGVIQLRRRA